MKRSAFIVAPVALLVGCGPTEYKPKPPPAVTMITSSALTADNILPAKVGDKWAYTADTISKPPGIVAAGAASMEFSVTDVKETPAGKKLWIDINSDGTLSDRQVWLLNAKGLYQLSAGIKSVEFVPPQPLLLFPIKDGQDFRWKGKGQCPDGVPGQIQSDSHVFGPQAIDLANGKGSGIAIRTVTMYKHGKAGGLVDSTNWFAPGKGIVRLKQTVAIDKGAVITTLIQKESK